MESYREWTHTVPKWPLVTRLTGYNYLHLANSCPASIPKRLSKGNCVTKTLLWQEIFTLEYSCWSHDKVAHKDLTFNYHNPSQPQRGLQTFIDKSCRSLIPHVNTCAVRSTVTWATGERIGMRVKPSQLAYVANDSSSLCPWNYRHSLGYINPHAAPASQPNSPCDFLEAALAQAISILSLKRVSQ